MSDDAKLEPCPNPECESDDVKSIYESLGYSHVYCNSCGMTGPSEVRIAEAESAWNALPRKPTPGPATQDPMAVLTDEVASVLAQLDEESDDPWIDEDVLRLCCDRLREALKQARGES